MPFTYGFYNSLNHDRVYNAEQVSQLFDGLIQDGVYAGVGEAMMVAKAESGGLNMVVKPGRAWFNHTWNLNDTDYPITLDTADVAQDRIDAIVIEVNSDENVRTNSIKVLKGAPSSVPAKPSMANTATLHQHPLAYVNVKQGSSEIALEDIEVVVGKDLETPFVTSICESVSIKDLYQQWTGQFNEWFDDIKAQLEGNVVTNLLNKIDQKLDKDAKASEEEALAGTDDTKYLTPLSATKLAESKAKEVVSKDGVYVQNLDWHDMKLRSVAADTQYTRAMVTSRMQSGVAGTAYASACFLTVNSSGTYILTLILNKTTDHTMWLEFFKSEEPNKSYYKYLADTDEWIDSGVTSYGALVDDDYIYVWLYKSSTTTYYRYFFKYDMESKTVTQTSKNDPSFSAYTSDNLALQTKMAEGGPSNNGKYISHTNKTYMYLLHSDPQTLSTGSDSNGYWYRWDKKMYILCVEKTSGKCVKVINETFQYWTEDSTDYPGYQIYGLTPSDDGVYYYMSWYIYSYNQHYHSGPKTDIFYYDSVTHTRKSLFSANNSSNTSTGTFLCGNLLISKEDNKCYGPMKINTPQSINTSAVTFYEFSPTSDTKYSSVTSTSSGNGWSNTCLGFSCIDRMCWLFKTSNDAFGVGGGYLSLRTNPLGTGYSGGASNSSNVTIVGTDAYSYAYPIYSFALKLGSDISTDKGESSNKFVIPAYLMSSGTVHTCAPLYAHIHVDVNMNFAKINKVALLDHIVLDE